MSLNIGQLHENLAQLVEEFATYNGELREPSIAGGACFRVSSRVEMAAQEQGMLASTVDYGGGYHFATMVDGMVIDFTARQFDPNVLFPWIGTKEEWLEECDHWRAMSEGRAG